jgi:DNA mismatch repair protein MutS
LVDEIQFLLGAVKFIKLLQDQGLPVCKPKIMEKERHCFSVKGLYNPVIAQQIKNSSPGSPASNIVLNDLEFDEMGRIFLLTGPNQGGKTVFTQAVGITQLMCQLGLFVPAHSASISPVDGIFTHFTYYTELNQEKGRFGDECFRLKQMFEKLTRHSLVLMDESFSSTSAIEGTYIASDVIKSLRALGCRAIFATHLHALAQNVQELNQTPSDSDSRVDNLSTKLIQSNNQNKRSFKIVREKPEGLSYAKDIAEKYGITFDSLVTTLKERRIIS